MSYPAHVTDTVYRYDGTFQGFLCCIFESYSRKRSLPPSAHLTAGRSAFMIRARS